MIPRDLLFLVCSILQAEPIFEEMKKLFNIEGTKLECKWNQPNEVISDEDFMKPFKASENYIRKQLTDIIGLK